MIEFNCKLLIAFGIDFCIGLNFISFFVNDVVQFVLQTAADFKVRDLQTLTAADFNWRDLKKAVDFKGHGHHETSRRMVSIL